MPRNGLTEHLVNIAAGVVAMVLLIAVAWLVWNSGILP
jgi:hypothetical protein